MSNEAFHTQYAKGWVRCVRCDCPRRPSETVVADNKRICKDTNACAKLAAAHNQALRDFGAERKLPEPEPEELASTPAFWNMAHLT